MINLAYFNSLSQIFRHFRNQSTCLQFIEEQIYPDGLVACPYCGGMHPYRRGDGRFKCRECGSSFSILQGTIFQDTKLPLYTSGLEQFSLCQPTPRAFPPSKPPLIWALRKRLLDLCSTRFAPPLPNQHQSLRTRLRLTKPMLVAGKPTSTKARRLRVRKAEAQRHPSSVWHKGKNHSFMHH